ncbi:hypothetical protein ACFY04_28455 [Streptomyces sp. NPDC001549]|uniref:hypothetical protein n=1 Tax=Streptomyces sp. NPDC001549 TaxID=3364586 RepID=UPI0036A329E2
MHELRAAHLESVNSVTGLPDPGHPARRLIANHKAAQRRRLTAMCERAGAQEPDDASAEITFLLEGAQVSAQNDSVDRAGDRLVAASRQSWTGARRRGRNEPHGLAAAQRAGRPSA